MDYTESLDWLDALVLHGVKAGLGHTRAVARHLGDPQGAFPSILIAGTNGKGSTAAFLDAILRAASLKTGLYTSPHLVDVRERVRVGGDPVEQRIFSQALSAVREAADEAQQAGEAEGDPTFFEAITLAAFRTFSKADVDLAAVEVGLGGRLDCTNIVEPKLSVVTSIGLDHQEYLGATLGSIAREKAGIFRPAVPALCGHLPPEAEAVVRAEAERLGAPLLFMSECSLEHDPSAGKWRLSCPEGRLALPRPSLLGAHQFANAALAVRAALLLRAGGFQISEDAIGHGIASARWPGRLEKVLESPQTWLDGAHNADGCQALEAFVQSLPHPRALVFTCMKDKDPGPMLEALRPAFDALWVTALPMARCASPATLAAKCPSEGTHLEPDPMAAVTAARAFAGESGAVVCAGSLYLVGHLLSHLQKRDTSLYGTGL